ncbi:hypothetical protein [Deinococcus aquatilis]|uniref:hypothetical protein n=1 Tax=Deinococcus aquatilis TaxID=519440 RepID=UPI00037F86D8|nr:hypothetical protein [Deinococcus aquatilis]
MRLLLLLLLFLTACTRSALPSAGPFTYRTTQGGAPLTWNLNIWPPNKSGPPKQLTHLAPGGLEGGFRWQLANNGNTVQLEFTGRNDQMTLPPRAVISLEVDGNPAYYGIVPDPPSGDSPDAEGVQVAGGEEALRLTLMDGKVYRDMGVYQIARDILSRLCPPSLTYLPSLIGDGSGTDIGPSLGTYYAPTSTLQEVLVSLAKSAGKTWGVDAQGRVFLGIPQTAALNVAYAGQPWRRLQVQGRETVTQAVLRVATSQAVEGVSDPYVTYSPAGVPKTITAIATDANHSLYRAQKAFEPPEGVGLLLAQLPALGTPAGGNYVDPAGAMDTDPGTWSEITLGPSQLGVEVASAVGRPVGVELLYSLPEVADMPDTFRLLVQTGTGAILLASLPTTSDVRTARVILPPDANTGDTWTAKVLAGANAAFSVGTPGVLRVYMVRFLFVDEARANTVAASFLQTPFASPTEITLNYLAPPTETVSITGSPDGTVTGPTGLFEYEHTPANVRTTKVRLGSTGSNELVRALRWAVRQ